MTTRVISGTVTEKLIEYGEAVEAGEAWTKEKDRLKAELLTILGIAPEVGAEAITLIGASGQELGTISFGQSTTVNQPKAALLAEARPELVALGYISQEYRVPAAALAKADPATQAVLEELITRKANSPSIRVVSKPIIPGRQ